MKAVGKSITDLETDAEWEDKNYRPMQLGMVEITASTDELKKLVKFLKGCIDQGDKYDHYHYQKIVGVYPDFVVMVEKKKKNKAD